MITVLVDLYMTPSEPVLLCPNISEPSSASLLPVDDDISFAGMSQAWARLCYNLCY